MCSIEVVEESLGEIKNMLQAHRARYLCCSCIVQRI